MTAKTIEFYLNNLRIALKGSDPATMQDALSDAEEHLSTALESAREENPDLMEADALEKIINAYGSPEETASAYQDIETRMPPTLATNHRAENNNPLARFFGIFGDPKAWGSFLYMLISLVTGVIFFTWAVTGLSLSLSFALFIFGLPFAAFFLVSTRWIGLVEGRIVEAMLGVRMPRRPAFFPKGMNWKEKLKMLVTDKFTWLVLLYMILQLPLGVLYFTLFITLLAFSLSLIALPFFQSTLSTSVIALPFLQSIFSTPLITFGNGAIYFIPIGYYPLLILGGLVLITATMHLAKAIGSWHGAYAKKILVAD